VASSRRAMCSPVAAWAAIPTDKPTDSASATSVLRPCPLGQQPDPARQLGGHVEHGNAIGRQPCGERRAQPAGALDGPSSMRPGPGEPLQADYQQPGLPIADTRSRRSEIRDHNSGTRPRVTSTV
jgi:hypothetical protein